MRYRLRNYTYFYKITLCDIYKYKYQYIERMRIIENQCNAYQNIVFRLYQMIGNMSWLSQVKSIDKSWLAFNSTLQIPFWMLCIIKSWESFQLWTCNLDPLK